MITRREVIRASVAGLGLYFLHPLRDASAWLERPLQPEVNPAEETNVTLQPRLEAICHQTITEKALSKLKENNPELAQYAHKIIQGSIDEDLIQVVNTNELDGGVRSRKHFLNPNAEEGKRGFYFFGVLQEDAYTHAEKLWNRAIERYRNGDKENAYHDIGRVVHLLEDCAQPEHTKRIDHFIKRVENWGIVYAHVGSPLEKWAASHSLDNLLLFSAASDVKPEETLRDLFYGMATESRNLEVLQYKVESDERNGRYTTKEAAESIDDKTAASITSYIVPRVVKRVEKLLELFGKAVSGTANTEELDLSTPEKTGDNYLTAYDNMDYNKLLQMTTGKLNNAFKKDSREQVIMGLRESVLEYGTTNGNVINKIIVYGPASQGLRKIGELSANEAEIQYFFNDNFRGIDGSGKSHRWTLRLRRVENSWFVYDQ